jgi:hypothetical protein
VSEASGDAPLATWTPDILAERGQCGEDWRDAVDHLSCPFEVVYQLQRRGEPKRDGLEL